MGCVDLSMGAHDHAMPLTHGHRMFSPTIYSWLLSGHSFNVSKVQALMALCHGLGLVVVVMGSWKFHIP